MPEIAATGIHLDLRESGNFNSSSALQLYMYLPHIFEYHLRLLAILDALL